MRQILSTLTLFFFLSVPLDTAAAETPDLGAYERFQRNADIVRLRHLEYYGELIEEYKDKTGRYPFAGEASVPVYVHVASPEQERFVSDGPPRAHEVRSMRVFVVALEEGLGRPVEERYDPQYRPDYKPNFYIYMVEQGTYFFAVHLHQDYPFSGKVAPKYHKVEVTSEPRASARAHLPEALFPSMAFKSAVNRSLTNPGFFEEREERFLHATKVGKGG